MSGQVLLREVRRILDGTGGATTGTLLQALRECGYVGTVGYLTWQLHEDPSFARGPGGRWTLVALLSRDKPWRLRRGVGNGAYGLHRCAHVGRCYCPQVLERW